MNEQTHSCAMSSWNRSFKDAGVTTVMAYPRSNFGNDTTTSPTNS